LYSSFSRILLGDLAQPDESPQPPSEVDSYGRLSQREREVLRLVALGHTNQEIADQLYLSVKTIETYRARVMNKLHLKSRSALVRYALQRGLLDSDR
jgi:two-component system response regulator NreC